MDWRHPLALVADLQRAARVAQRGGSPLPQRQAWYRLDLAASESTGRLTVEVLMTEGEGGLRPLAPEGIAPEGVLEPDDRWLVELLTAFPGEGARRWLPPALFETVLPRLCATGRFGWQPRAAVTPGTLQPLAWQGAPPWRFALALETRDGGAALALTGTLRRKAETRPLREPLLLLTTAGLVVFPSRVARLEAVDQEPWITVLRQAGAIRVPAAQREDLGRALAALPVPPDPLPDGLPPLS
jgi:hypothetical protein